jgi:hypothetical protein
VGRREKGVKKERGPSCNDMIKKNKDDVGLLDVTLPLSFNLKSGNILSDYNIENMLSMYINIFANVLKMNVHDKY